MAVAAGLVGPLLTLFLHGTAIGVAGSMDGEHHVLSTHIPVRRDTSKDQVPGIKEQIRHLARQVGSEHTTLQIGYGTEGCFIVACPADEVRRAGRGDSRLTKRDEHGIINIEKIYIMEAYASLGVSG